MRFYILEDVNDRGGSIHTTFAAAPPDNRQASETCAKCGEPVGLLTWLPPYRAHLEFWTHECGDLALDGDEGFLASESFRQAYVHWGLTGLRGFDEVEIVDVKRHQKLMNPIPHYYYARVLRTSTRIDEVRSGIVRRGASPACPQCGRPSVIQRWSRIVVEHGTETPPDMFIPHNVQLWITSERFRECMEVECLKNVPLVPADEYWRDFEPWDNLERAREILAAPIGPMLWEKRLITGEVWRYDKLRNYAVIYGPDGTIRQVFRPVDLLFWDSGPS